jgi:hypothetical protein
MKNYFTKEQGSPAAGDFTDPLVGGSLNDLLRKKLNQLNTSECILGGENIQEQDVDMAEQSLSGCIISSVSEMLNESVPNTVLLERKLHLLFDRLYAVYQQADITSGLRKRQFISQHGLIISPEQCVTTQKDTLRVRSFIRSADQAIAKLSEQFSCCLHIVYPACGPFAPLLLPLIAYYKETGRYDENNLRITLIDMQQGAVISLDTLVNELGISGYINAILCQDACQYQTSSPIHLVVLEAMQHGFSKEGHLPMARHFASLIAGNGIMLPEEVSIRGVLSPAQQEFVEQWQDKNNRVCATGMQAKNISHRVELGEILTLNLDSLRQLKVQQLDKNTHLIECGTVTIPPLPENSESGMEKLMLMICTHIKTYGDEVIGEYDSGITHPLPDMHVCINFTPRDVKPGDLLVKTADKLKFYYRLNGLPGFLATASV